MIAKSKPIFVIEVPKGNDIAKIRNAVKIDLYDYHVLVFSSPISEIKFNTFYAKDMNVVKFNELKEIVKYAVK